MPEAIQMWREVYPPRPATISTPHSVTKPCDHCRRRVARKNAEYYILCEDSGMARWSCALHLGLEIAYVADVSNAVSVTVTYSRLGAWEAEAVTVLI